MRHATRMTTTVALAAAGLFGLVPAAYGQAKSGAEDLEKLKTRVTQLEQETEQLHKDIAALKEQLAAAKQGSAPVKPKAADLESAPGAAGNLVRARARANQMGAAATLKMLVTTQSISRQTDMDKNGTMDYWTRDVAGLHCIHDANGKGVMYIDLATARADKSPGAAYPELAGVTSSKQGYFFQAMTTDQDGNPYLQKDLPTPTVPGAPGGVCGNQSRFGFCAWPAKYPADGVMTIVVNEDGVLWQKDTGGEPVLNRKQASPESAGSGWKEFGR